MRFGKRLLAVFMSFLLIASLAVTPAAAANSNGDLTAVVVEKQDSYYLVVTYTSGNNSIKAGTFEVLSPDGKTMLHKSPVLSFGSKSGTYSFKLADDVPANAILRMTEDKGNKPATATDVFAKGFVMPVIPPEEPFSGVLVADFGSGNAGNIRVVEFNVTPDEDSDGTVMGIAGVTAPAILPVAVKLDDGVFMAVNNGAFGAFETVSYKAGLTYHFKVMINLPVGTYDVWVTEEFNTPINFSKPGGTLVQLAKDYKIAEGATLANIGGVYAEGDVAITNARLIPSDFISSIIGPDAAYNLESDNTTKEMAYKFDVEFVADNIDFLLCLHDGAVVPTEGAWMWLRYIFHTDQGSGTFDAYNNNGYASIANPRVPTKGGVIYHVKMDFYRNEEAAQWRYDVWLTPEDGTPVKIAENYQARATSNTLAPYENLNKLIIASAPAKIGWVSNGVMLYSGQLKAAVNAVNAAVNANVMSAALTSTSLGLSLSLYDQLSQADKNEIHQAMYNLKQESSFADDLAIQAAFENLVREKVQPPAPATNLLVMVKEKTNQAIISWDLSPDGSAIRFYEVGRSEGPVFDPDNYVLVYTARGAAASNASDSSLTANTQYTYAIKVVNIVALESVWSKSFTVWSGDEPIMPFGTELVRTAFNAALTKYSLIASNNASYFGVDQSIPGAPKQAMGEWGSAGKGSSEAFKYLVSVCQYDPYYIGPDGVTTVEDRVLAHVRSLIAGGNEWGCSGTGLSAQGYSPAVLALAAIKMTLPDTWAKLSAAEQAKVDLLMEATLVGAHYATADTNYNLKSLGYDEDRIPVLFTDNPFSATTGVDQTGNYERGWNINHRVGVLTAIAAYYYFGGAAPASEGSKFKTAGSEYCNTVLAEFDYDVFMARLKDAGFTNIHTIFSSAGKYDDSLPIGPYNYPQIALQPHTRSSSLSEDGEYMYYGNSMDNISAWLLEFITASLGSGPVRPYGGDNAKPNLTPMVSNYPPYNQNQSIFRPYGYPGFILDDKDYDTYGGSAALGVNAVDTLLNFPNLGAPGMYMEFDTNDGSDPAAPDKEASGARTSVGYVSEGMPYLVDSFYMLQIFDGPDAGGNVAGIPADEYGDLLAQTVAGMDDFLYKNNVRYQGYHKGFYRRNEHASGNNILWQVDAWKNIVDNPANKVTAVNTAVSTSAMREAIEDPFFGLVLFQYNGLSDAGKNAVMAALLTQVHKKPKYFTMKSDTQTALADAVAVEAVKDLNKLTTAQEILTALTVDLSPRTSKYTPNALGIFVYGFTNKPNTGESGAKKLLVCQYVLDNIGDGYADKRTLRDTIIRGLADALPAPIRAVNNATSATEMLAALTSAELGLDLTAMNRLTEGYQLQAAAQMIKDKPSSGFSSKPEIQNMLNGVMPVQFQSQLLGDVNATSTPAAMLAALTNPEFNLNLAIFNALSVGVKQLVAQAMIDGRPSDGYATKAAVQTAFDAVILANSDVNPPVTFTPAAAVCLDGGGSTPSTANTNLGANNWASLKTDPLLTMAYTRCGYIKLDLSPYADLTPESLVSLSVRINIISAPFDSANDDWLNKVAMMALYPCKDTTQTQTSATYANVITANAAEFGAGQASGWRPTPASNTVSYSSPGFYEFDVTEYVRAQLTQGKKAVAFILAHTHILQSTHQFSPLGAAANTRPQAILITQANPLASVNSAAGAADMAAALGGLNLVSFNALGTADKETVAAFVLSARPAAGYADTAAVQAAVDTAVAELSKVETVMLFASVGVGIDAGGSNPKGADNNAGSNNWANFRSDGVGGQAPDLSWPYNRLGYFMYDLTSYTASADELVALKVLIDIYQVDPTREANGIRVGLLPHADTGIGQFEATYNNVVANNRKAIGDTLFSPVLLKGPGYYELDVTDYAKAELAKGNSKIAFLLVHETAAGSGDMFRPLGAADNMKPYAVLTKREVVLGTIGDPEFNSAKLPSTPSPRRSRVTLMAVC